jgi:hypothetical protein
MILNSIQASDYFWKSECFSGQFKFFTSLDKFLYPENSVIFFVVEMNSIPVCVAHLSKDYDFSQKTSSFRYKNPSKITFISTRLGYESRGLARSIIDEILDWSKKNEVTLVTGSYSQEGWKKIRPHIIESAKSRGVTLLDSNKII